MGSSDAAQVMTDEPWAASWQVAMQSYGIRAREVGEQAEQSRAVGERRRAGAGLRAVREECRRRRERLLEAAQVLAAAEQTARQPVRPVRARELVN